MISLPPPPSLDGAYTYGIMNQPGGWARMGLDIHLFVHSVQILRPVALSIFSEQARCETRRANKLRPDKLEPPSPLSLSLSFSLSFFLACTRTRVYTYYVSTFRAYATTRRIDSGNGACGRRELT